MKRWTPDDFLSAVAAIGIVAVFVFFIFVAEAARAGSKCDEYEQGFNDGYCSTKGRIELCVPPVFRPICFESDWDSGRQAYHTGFGEGVQYGRDEP
jgi:hypothetical protein